LITRGAYPIEFIKNSKVPCIAGHPAHIIFLTCDAFGVLPPVSKLTSDQAMYHFISGYTAKVAGTEMGVTEPSATFSACFGAPFLVWHPNKYAELLAKKIKEHKVSVWLINTGWSGGGYGTGARIKLRFTRSIIDAIHSGSLAAAPTQRDPIFGLQAVTQVPDVPEKILIPEQVWTDKNAFTTTSRKLAGLFISNFEKYESGSAPGLRSAGPILSPKA
jgi:phosphoenolpyruvate carboxykinase (ATP)